VVGGAGYVDSFLRGVVAAAVQQVIRDRLWPALQLPGGLARCQRSPEDGPSAQVEPLRALEVKAFHVLVIDHPKVLVQVRRVLIELADG
jgi:hypothetical protein